MLAPSNEKENLNTANIYLSEEKNSKRKFSFEEIEEESTDDESEKKRPTKYSDIKKKQQE